MYQSHNFEKAVKRWFVSQISKRQAEFKKSLQSVEQNVWRNVPFTQKLFLNKVTLNNSLSESMKIKGDHILVSFLNEFDHQVDSDFEERLVSVQPEFSNENEFRKDVQITFDENLINNYLLALFNSSSVLSVADTVIGWLPDSIKKYAKPMSSLLSTLSLAKVFPDLIADHGMGKAIDVRCGFSKSFLTGKLNERHTS